MEIKPITRLNSKYNFDVKNQTLAILKENLCVSKKQFKTLFIKNAKHLGNTTRPFLLTNMSENNWNRIIYYLVASINISFMRLTKSDGSFINPSINAAPS